MTFFIPERRRSLLPRDGAHPHMLTVAFVYCCARVAQIEQSGEKGCLHHLWIVVMVLLFMLYGFYTWRP